MFIIIIVVAVVAVIIKHDCTLCKHSSITHTDEYQNAIELINNDAVKCIEAIIDNVTYKKPANDAKLDNLTRIDIFRDVEHIIAYIIIHENTSKYPMWRFQGGKKYYKVAKSSLQTRARRILDSTLSYIFRAESSSNNNQNNTSTKKQHLQKNIGAKLHDNIILDNTPIKKSATTNSDEELGNGEETVYNKQTDDDDDDDDDDNNDKNDNADEEDDADAVTMSDKSSLQLPKNILYRDKEIKGLAFNNFSKSLPIFEKLGISKATNNNKIELYPGEFSHLQLGESKPNHITCIVGSVDLLVEIIHGIRQSAALQNLKTFSFLLPQGIKIDNEV